MRATDYILCFLVPFNILIWIAILVRMLTGV